MTNRREFYVQSIGYREARKGPFYTLATAKKKATSLARTVRTTLIVWERHGDFETRKGYADQYGTWHPER